MHPEAQMKEADKPNNEDILKNIRNNGEESYRNDDAARQQKVNPITALEDRGGARNSIPGGRSGLAMKSDIMSAAQSQLYPAGGSDAEVAAAQAHFPGAAGQRVMAHQPLPGHGSSGQQAAYNQHQRVRSSSNNSGMGNNAPSFGAPATGQI